MSGKRAAHVLVTSAVCTSTQYHSAWLLIRDVHVRLMDCRISWLLLPAFGATVLQATCTCDNFVCISLLCYNCSPTRKGSVQGKRCRLALIKHGLVMTFRPKGVKCHSATDTMLRS